MRKVALDTGGAVRVGRAITIGLAEAGYDMMVHYHSSQAAAREVARRVEGLGRRAAVVAGDLSVPGDVEGVAEAVQAEYGRVDLLVNSASTFRAADLLEVDVPEWDDVMNVNLRGPFLMVKATAAMLRASRGSVVNILDLSAMEPWTQYPHHAVSKAGLLHLTRVLARVMAPSVRVNAVAPGTVLPPEGEDPTRLERERRSTPVGRLGSPEDVVRTVLFLAGAPFITGEVVVVDGGRSLERG